MEALQTESETLLMLVIKIFDRFADKRHKLGFFYSSFLKQRFFLSLFLFFFFSWMVDFCLSLCFQNSMESNSALFWCKIENNQAIHVCPPQFTSGLLQCSLRAKRIKKCPPKSRKRVANSMIYEILCHRKCTAHSISRCRTRYLVIQTIDLMVHVDDVPTASQVERLKPLIPVPSGP